MPALVPALALAISLSSHGASARPVAIGLRVTYQMQCGWPGPEIDVLFPAAERLPATVAPSSVLVDGKPAAGVNRVGRTISVSIARPAGAMCDVIGPGTARVLFTRAAGIGNPTRPGSYTIAASHGTSSARGSFVVR